MVKRSSSQSKAVTANRAARFCRMLQLLGKGPQARETLTRQLRCDVRSFYRDLVELRKIGIKLVMERGRYALEEDVDDAIARLPFPDPVLTLGEARQLAQGRTEAHRRLKTQIDQILSGPTAKRSRK